MPTITFHIRLCLSTQRVFQITATIDFSILLIGLVQSYKKSAEPLATPTPPSLTSLGRGVRASSNSNVPIFFCQVYEGEVTELTPVETESPGVTSGAGKTISHLIIGLKTAKGTKQLKLDPSIYESLQKEHVQVRFRLTD